jgi:ankyrin repeat protein
MAYTGDILKAALLLDRGADLEALDEEFRSTPLGVAARFGKREMVEFLLDRGADPNKAGAHWATPLEWARKKGHADIASVLRSAGATGSRARPRPLPQNGAPDVAVEKAFWTAVRERDAATLGRLLAEHRTAIGALRPSLLDMDTATIFARTHSARGLPVRPDMRAIEHEVQAEGGGEAGRDAVADAYGAGSWERLSLAVRLVDAIWRDDLDAVQEIVTAHPRLLHEDALIRLNSNWGPPMTYAANLGRHRIIQWLHAQGARDIESAMDRAVLQGQIDTARMLLQLGAPVPGRAVFGPAETLNAEGMSFLVDLGVDITADLAAVGMVLETYARNPLGKHQILELFARQGVALPDTPTMAVHRGRIDLLHKHLRHDPQLFSRTFAHEEMFPPELGCHSDEVSAMTGTPLGGTGLLNMSIEYGEMELAAWMIEHGADVNLRARVDADGFGGHTPLFNAVVCLGGGGQRHGEFARMLLARGADPSTVASLRKALHGGDDDSLHEYRDVTAREWGEQFHHRGAVNATALDIVRRWKAAR